MNFEELKQRSGSGELLKTLQDTDIQKSGLKIQKRVINSLIQIGDEYGLGSLSLAHRMNECRKGQFCGNVYCMECRLRATGALRERFQDHIEKRFEDDKELARKSLRYVTVLCELTDFNLETIKKSVEQARKNRNAVKRHFKTKGIKLWGQGAFEFELMDMNLLMSSKTEGSKLKQKTLAKMSGMDIPECRSLGHQVIVHFHMLVDLNGANEEEFKSYLKKRFGNVGRQIDVARIHKNQELTEMMDKLSSYGFKNRHRYNFVFDTDGYLRGDYFDDESLGRLATIYNGVGNNGYTGLLISL